MERKYASLLLSNFVVGRGSLDFLETFNNRHVAVIHGGPNVLSDSKRDRIQLLIGKSGGDCLFASPILREPYYSDIQSIVGEIREYKPDMIVALGGGAVMDTAKVVQLLYENPEMTQEDLTKPYQLPDLGKKAVLVAIPTTSGTGSETTSAAVFTDDNNKSKCLMLGNGLIPTYAILDADFTDSLPATIAGFTGIDALTHAMEAATCTIASPMVKSLAINAAVDLFENLGNSTGSEVSTEVKRDAREMCHIAASMAGVAITNSCTGLAHGLDQPGPHFGVPHGQTCGILLPYTLAFTGVHPSHVTVAKRLGLEDRDDKANCQALVDYTVQINSKIGLPASFSELNIDEGEYMDNLERFTQLAVPSMATKLSSRVPSEEEIKDMLKASYYGTQPVLKDW